MFEVDGAQYPLAEMLGANADDAPLCDWLRNTQVGESFPALVTCKRVG